MGVRLRPINQSWTGIYNSVADLIAEAGRAKGAGMAALGAGIGGGLSNLGAGIRSKRQENRAQANIEADNARADRAHGRADKQWDFHVAESKFQMARGSYDAAAAQAQLEQQRATLTGDTSGLERAVAEMEKWKPAMEAASANFFQAGGQPPPAWAQAMGAAPQTEPFTASKDWAAKSGAASTTFKGQPASFPPKDQWAANNCAG